MARDFINVIHDLENLLCHHITDSLAGDFVDELVDILRAVLNIDRHSHWSYHSFLYDLRQEYFRQHLTSEQAQSPRPENNIYPRLNRSVVEPLATMPMTHDIGPDMPAFAIRYADQFYNGLRRHAKMPYKPFVEVLTENGFPVTTAATSSSSASSATTTGAGSVEMEADDAAMHDDSAPVVDSGSVTGSVSEHAPECDPSLLSKLVFLEDRLFMLERKEETLEGQLDRATQAIAALRSTNLDLARKVSEVQQRNHDLRRTYAA